MGVDDGGILEEGGVAGLDDAAVEEFFEELVGGGVELVGLGVVEADDALLFVVGDLAVFGHCVGVAFFYGFADEHQAVDPDDVVGAKIVQQVDFFLDGYGATLAAFEVGDDADLVEMAYGELCDGVEAAEGVNAVVEEFDAEGFFVGEGEDVDDAAADGELSGLDDEVDALEVVFLQGFDDEVHIELAALEDLQRVACQRFGGYDLFGECFGIGYDDHPAAAGELLDDFGAHQDVGVVGLVGVVWAPVGGWEEHHVERRTGNGELRTEN